MIVAEHPNQLAETSADVGRLQQIILVLHLPARALKLDTELHSIRDEDERDNSK